MAEALRKLNDVEAILQALAPKELEDIKKQVSESLPVWVPNPGPQYDARNCEADELFYGGQAGGGKSDLVIGLSLTEHHHSLILRRYNKDVKALSDRMLDEMLSNRDGWNGQDSMWRGKGGKVIEFSGCQEEKDKQRWKGRPHDFIGFDEIGDFLESQYRFIIGWNRTTKEGQRCRVVCTGNPPTEAGGLWIIQYWAPWLDPTHPNPAREGELRWFTTVGGKDVEVDGRGPHKIEGERKPLYARSRTFIRARLEDNPDLMRDGQYEAVLDSLPKELRDAYRDGSFDASMKDNPWQTIPTAWVMAAQKRWTENPPVGVPMCAIGVDVAQGGAANNVIAPRYDGWYAPLTVVPGTMTPLGGSTIAGIVVSKRRNDAVVIVDCGGGYGGPVYQHLRENGIECVAYKGSEASQRKTDDQKLHFYNRRTEVHWRFREALDPDQPGGSRIQLPPDTRILADLTAPTYEVRSGGKIVVESKEDVEKRLGRSTDFGDAVTMAWSAGNKMENSYKFWGVGGTKPAPQVLRTRTVRRR